MEDTRHRLVRSLTPAKFRTGTQLGAILGLSRAAIHKHVQALVERGLPIHRVPGRGYRLADGVVLLDERAITSRLSPRARALLGGIKILEEVDSTNAELLRTMESHPMNCRVCLAEKQTAGRGRRGRRWLASPYRDLMMSIGIEYPQWPERLPSLGLVTGLTMIKALECFGAQGLMLKWPNDVLHEFKKLCGVLLDVTGEAHGPCRVIVGIGLNVSMSSNQSWSIGQDWVDLATITGQAVNRNAIAAQALNLLLPVFQSFPSDGFDPYLSDWRRVDALKSRAVTIHAADGTMIDGTAAGIDESGRLWVTRDHGAVTAFSQGDVTVRVR
ncbi:MAG: Bifunctional ligase/repressor BirA [Gammaproteobacteria bacterium]|nr:Bifunctional ligase/repressor BirA [Gammaproteobacteria bacterium]